MGNPFAPRPAQPKPPAPSGARLPIARLRAAGATAPVIAEAERRWAGATHEERRQSIEALDASTDDELRVQCLEVEFWLACVAAEISPEDEPTTAIGLLDEAIANNGTVEAARSWVKDDADRALAMLVAERRRPENEHRKTLIEPLEAVLRGI